MSCKVVCNLERKGDPEIEEERGDLNKAFH